MDSRSVAVPEIPGPGEVSAAERTRLFMDGTLGPDDLTDDECLKCQIVGKNMKFGGRPSHNVPRSIVNMLHRELIRRMENKFASHLGEAIDTVVDVMRNGEGEQFSQFERAGTQRLKAAGMVIDRVMGPIQKERPPELGQTPWQQMVEAGGLVVDVEDPATVVVDVEVVDEERPRRRRGPRGG